ncbi:MAG: phosphoribosyl transferase [Parachlamydiaceae bacterium]|nr:phosphoribosyl transferase [Parachlamydiaceae bacterium]
MSFKNRQDAGKQLCQLLSQYKGLDVVVYALPRGGVVVAAEIAKYLHAPLDLILAHKIGHPNYEEYAIAAVSEKGHLIGTPNELESVGHSWLQHEKHRQIEEIKRKRALYLKGRKDVDVEDKVAIIVDDGIATGLTMQVGILELKDRNPSKIVAVVPVSPKETADKISSMVDDFVAVVIPAENMFLGAVGAYYDEFNQIEDEEVIDILKNYSGDISK